MADEDLEQEVARLRGKLKSLTIITVLFMLAVGALAGVVLAKVSKKPAETPPPTEYYVEQGDTSAKLTPMGLQLTGPNGAAANLMFDGARHHLFFQEVKAGNATTLAAGELDVASNGGKTAVSLQTESPEEPAIQLETPAGVLRLDRSALDKLLNPPPPPAPAPGQPGAPAPAPAEP
jgi:hypothetical protein